MESGKSFPSLPVLVGIILVLLFAGIGYFLFTYKTEPQETESPSPTHIEEVVLPTTTKFVSQPVGLNNCFYDAPLNPQVDTSKWQIFEGYGFVVKYPSDSISIKKIVNPNSDVANNFVISSLTSSDTVDVKVYKLQEDIYRARYMHTAPVAYEPYSDTWWKTGSYSWTWNSSNFEQCNPNPRGRTNDGKYYVYSTQDGDAGASFTYTFVVFRDIPPNDDHYEPLVVEFWLRDGGESGSSFYPTFEKIVETIIRTLELRPTSKG